MYKLTNSEKNAIIKLSANKRFEYSIKRIADKKSLWVIGDANGLKTYSVNEKIIFPIWPFKEYALLCCIGEYSGCEPEELELDDFINEYIPDFVKDGYMLTVLPLSTNRGAVIEIETFQEALQNELDKY
jgi:hypothetical protein